MKKILLVGALALSSLFASAQDGLQGVWFAGGNVTLSSSKDKATDIKTEEYTVMPLLGKFITPSVAIGGALGFTHIGNDKNNGTGNSFIIQPLARKYWNIGGNFYFFGQAALPVEFGHENKDGSRKNTFGVHAQFSPGFDLIVNDWFTVEASFTLLNAGYTRSKPKDGKATDTWSLNGKTIGSSKVGDVSVGVKFLF